MEAGWRFSAACSTHMHQGVVGLFAGVEQEVERPSVLAPLDGFQRRETESDVKQRTHKKNKKILETFRGLKRTSLLGKYLIWVLEMKTEDISLLFLVSVCMKTNQRRRDPRK